ncbi:MAG: hypothetical protein C4345_03865, partial [Chloroflexota bacterium]
QRMHEQGQRWPCFFLGRTAGTAQRGEVRGPTAMNKPYNYGGQAVIEGVMMRGRNGWAVAVRHPSGHIIVREQPLTSIVYRSRWGRWPFIRGIATLWDTLSLGMRALLFSANV